jgi:transcriptional regulator with XRE-family HTH domain
MSHFYTLFDACLKAKKLTTYRLAKLSPVSPVTLHSIKTGKYGPSDVILSDLAAVPELGLSLETLRAWRALDQYEGLTLAESTRLAMALCESPEERLAMAELLLQGIPREAILKAAQRLQQADEEA